MYVILVRPLLVTIYQSCMIAFLIASLIEIVFLIVTDSKFLNQNMSKFFP
jgi:hypothetical protein